MKTYTIRPLEWKGIDPVWEPELENSVGGLLSFAGVSRYLYTITANESGYKMQVSVNGEIIGTIGGSTIAAAKELAWQDWLRRITPALEEVK